MKAEKVLELNPEHDVVKKLQDAYREDGENKDSAAAMTRLLYDQAALISGLTISDPLQMSNDINLIMMR